MSDEDREVEIRALGTLLAGEVDGNVDELAAYIMNSPWMTAHDYRVADHARQGAYAFLKDVAANTRQAQNQ